jgi:uncharacterized protein YqeY
MGMMTLLDEVSRGITEAMKSRDQDVLGTLRMLKTALTNKEIEKGRPLEEAEGRQVVSTLVKQRRDSIEQFTRGGRTDLADKESREIVILERFLPAAATPEAIDAVVLAAIAETGASGPKDFGKVMKAAIAALAGTSVDGKQVSEVVKRRLA